MSVDKEEFSMSEMMKEIDQSMSPIQNGDIIKGKVISVTDEEVLVNIGYITDGIISKEELSNDEEATPRELVKAGDEIDVYIIKVNDGEGNLVLSKKRAEAIKTWNQLEQALNNGAVLSVKVAEIVKGGAVVYIEGVRAFIPASHISYRYVKDLNEFLGKELVVKVIELDREKKRVILSRKEVEKVEVEAKKEELWSTLEKGEKRKGIVSRLAKFGAFVDLGGIDGLIHISDLSWKRVNNPDEVVSVGDQVEVYVLDFDKEKGRISLGLKEIDENPWTNIADRYKTGDIIDGSVVRLTNFGAFVEIEPGVDGLVHISQISDERVANPSDVLGVGAKVKVKILDINQADKKLSLSIKDAMDKVEEDFSEYSDIQGGGVTIGDILKDKLKGLKFD